MAEQAGFLPAQWSIRLGEHLQAHRRSRRDRYEIHVLAYADMGQETLRVNSANPQEPASETAASRLATSMSPASVTAAARDRRSTTIRNPSSRDGKTSGSAAASCSVTAPGVKADRCDPVHEDLTVAKIGMVATTRPGDGEPLSRSEFARAPEQVLQQVSRELDLY